MAIVVAYDVYLEVVTEGTLDDTWKVSKPGSFHQFHEILAKQMPDTEKRARADFVIETDTMESARTQVRAILSQIRAGLKHA